MSPNPRNAYSTLHSTTLPNTTKPYPKLPSPTQHYKHSSSCNIKEVIIPSCNTNYNFLMYILEKRSCKLMLFFFACNIEWTTSSIILVNKTFIAVLAVFLYRVTIKETEAHWDKFHIF